MGKKISAPPPIDVEKTAAAQSQANKEAVYASADVSSANQFTPWGSVTYDKDERGVPLAQYTNLTPGSQYVFDQQMETAGGLGDIALAKLYQAPLDEWSTSHLPNDPAKADFSQLQGFKEKSLGREASFDPRGLRGFGGPVGGGQLTDYSQASFFGSTPQSAQAAPGAMGVGGQPGAAGPMGTAPAGAMGARNARLASMHGGAAINPAFLQFANPRASQEIGYGGPGAPAGQTTLRDLERPAAPTVANQATQRQHHDELLATQTAAIEAQRLSETATLQDQVAALQKAEEERKKAQEAAKKLENQRDYSGDGP